MFLVLQTTLRAVHTYYISRYQKSNETTFLQGTKNKQLTIFLSWNLFVIMIFLLHQNKNEK